jgi:ATP-dependent DNA helicase RecG
MRPLALNTPIKDMFMVGPTYAARLKKLNILTVEDLLHHYPFRYDDFSKISLIATTNIGDTVTIRGKILQVQNIYTKHGKKIQKAVVADSSGTMEVVWFNQPFLVKTIKTNVEVSLSGNIGWFDRKKALIAPEYEILGYQNTIHTGRLVPIYPETYGLSSKWLRSRLAPLVAAILPQVNDWLPQDIKQQYQLIDLATALKQIHFPENQQEIEAAKKRLAFDELFLMQLRSKQQKQGWQKNKVAFPFFIDQEKIMAFISSLPFSLTNSQNRSIKEILTDLERQIPMNRLLEGDVGSGKTVVATVAMYAAFLNGLQSSFMAPTEILAQQHYQTIKTLLEPLGVKVALITGSSKPLNTKSNPSAGRLDSNIIVGTHALLYGKFKLAKLGLVTIDEQHRFGVEQRAQLIHKSSAPHVLTMTATPIPRTAALTLYGDLDLSVLDEMPLGRKLIKTWVVPPQKREAAYSWINEQISQNHSQAFIVCPLIQESEKESMQDIKAATVEFKRLVKDVFPNLRLGLLHGKIKARDKEKILTDFRNNKINILVATPVVEVGIDIPNAAIMMIEGAERFGLAQLHQLRGRVGRSHQQSYCLLFTSQETAQVTKRLRAMEKYYSGFTLAEIDLKLRGPGDVYGLQQHGFKRLKIASFSDLGLIKATEQAAKQIISNIDKFPLLKSKLQNYTMQAIEPN